jgi:hypothetical protein
MPLLRWILIALVGSVVLGWLTLTPRSASAYDFVADLEQGNVERYEIGPPQDHVVFRGFGPGESSEQLVVWCTGPLTCHSVPEIELFAYADEEYYADGRPAQDEDLVGDGEIAAGEDFAGPNESLAVTRLMARHSGDSRPKPGDTNPWSGALSVGWTAAWLVMLFVLITGPQPRRATKWAVAWVSLLPGGLGLIWALTREAPWSRRAADLPEPPPGPLPGRWTGGWAFLAVLFVSQVVAELPSMVRDLIP